MTHRPPEHDQGGRLAPLPPTVLVGWGLAGFVLGWVIRHAVAWAGQAVPVIGWVQAVALFFVAAVLAAVARSTRTALASPARRPEAQLMVNRLVLARACALIGALMAGAYAGYALSWIGVASELTGERILRSMVASAGGLSVVVGAVVLERACRVPPDDDSA